MRPTSEGIRLAAYERWERRGRVHGFDRADWLAAERQQRFARNYRVVAADRLDTDAPRAVGHPTRRRCRFCGQGAPRAAFGGPVPIFGPGLGPGGPVAFDQCDECVAAFADGIDPALARFLRPACGPHARGEGYAGAIAVDAFKGLVKLALAAMPPDLLDEHEETIEWVGNPDHDFDLNVFRDLACVVHECAEPSPASWSALAARQGDDEAWPSTLFFLGTGRAVFQIAVPLGRGDDDLDVPLSAVPDVLPPSPFGPWHDPDRRSTLPVVACSPQRGTARRTA